MNVTFQRYEDIKEVVAYTLRRGFIKELPICGFKLTRELGVKCIPYSSLSLQKQSACIQLSEEGFTLDRTIYYNDFQIPTRIRFTIMHEIGHIMLDHLEDDDVAELEANFFAGFILVPPVLVYAHDRTNDMDQEQIKKLFDVSNPVAENTYNYYQKWAKRNSIMFGLSETDTQIYNQFFGSISID